MMSGRIPVGSSLAGNHRMPPCPLSAPALYAPAASRRAESTAPAIATTPTAPGQVPLALRLAQRAFAALIEYRAGASKVDAALRSAQRRSAARRTLSTLSADDRPRLARWLAVQVASRDAEPDLPLLARVDALLGARVTALLAGTRDELGTARRNGGVAAA